MSLEIAITSQKNTDFAREPVRHKKIVFFGAASQEANFNHGLFLSKQFSINTLVSLVLLFSCTKLSCISAELEDAITQSKGLLFLKKRALHPLVSGRYIFIF